MNLSQEVLITVYAPLWAWMLWCSWIYLILAMAVGCDGVAVIKTKHFWAGLFVVECLMYLFFLNVGVRIP